MKGRFCCFVIALQIVSWVSAARRPFPPTGGHSNHGHTEFPQTSSNSVESKKSLKSIESKPETIQEEYGRGISKIGSSPPSCEHKCYGCIPCEAVQVPSTNRRSHLCIQYADYEPERWKCKCGPSFYSP